MASNLRDGDVGVLFLDPPLITEDGDDLLLLLLLASKAEGEDLVGGEGVAETAFSFSLFINMLANELLGDVFVDLAFGGGGGGGGGGALVHCALGESINTLAALLGSFTAG